MADPRRLADHVARAIERCRATIGQAEAPRPVAPPLWQAQAAPAPGAGRPAAPHVQAAIGFAGGRRPEATVKNSRRTVAPAPLFVAQASRRGRTNVWERVKETNLKEEIRQVKKTYDPKGRTRRAKAGQKQVKKIVERAKVDPEFREELLTLASKNTPPRRLLSGATIYSGKGRGFSKEFAERWWDDLATPWECAICKQEIDPKGTGKDAPSIDHRESFAQTKLTVTTYTVCKDGVHWEVALTEEVRGVIEDESNLRPAHQGCNSSKSGSKNTDSIAPQRKGPCPGEDCKAQKAE